MDEKYERDKSYVVVEGTNNFANLMFEILLIEMKRQNRKKENPTWIILGANQYVIYP